MENMQKYYAELCRVQQEIVEKEHGVMLEVAREMALVLKEGRMIHIFGCGHSHLLIEEAFYRAGGLAKINPIFDSPTMLHNGGLKSSYLEREEGYGHMVYERQNMQPRDILFVYSTSGVNGCPLEVARCAKEAGVTVVAVCSGNYAGQPSRHSSGKHLADFATYTIDTHVPRGDALIDGPGGKIAPCSTAASVLIWNMLIAQVAEEGEKIGYTPEYLISGNVENGKEKNEETLEKYRSVIPAF